MSSGGQESRKKFVGGAYELDLVGVQGSLGRMELPGYWALISSFGLGWAAIVLLFSGLEMKRRGGKGVGQEEEADQALKMSRSTGRIHPWQLIEMTTWMPLHLDRGTICLLSRMACCPCRHCHIASACWLLVVWPGMGCRFAVPQQCGLPFPALALHILHFCCTPLAVTLGHMYRLVASPKATASLTHKEVAAFLIGQVAMWSLASPPASVSPVPWHA
jgi:hypothetical protein